MHGFKSYHVLVHSYGFDGSNAKDFLRSGDERFSPLWRCKGSSTISVARKSGKEVQASLHKVYTFIVDAYTSHSRLDEFFPMFALKL